MANNNKPACTAIGIDLGTTNTVVAVWNGREVEVLRNGNQNTITPSFVAYEPNGQRLVGWSAFSAWERNPENTVFSAKRFMGRLYEEGSIQDTLAATRLPYSVVDNQGKCGILAKVRGAEEILYPEEISAAILNEVRSLAEEKLNCRVRDVVITVPAYFNSAQREATYTAAKIAGLNVLALLNEPTAAAIAYGLHERQEKHVLVFDFGGGTLDVTIMHISGKGEFRVLATGGDSRLGGDDFDLCLVNHFLDAWNEKHPGAAPMTSSERQKLLNGCRQLKEALTDQPEECIDIPNFRGETFSLRMTRARFEKLSEKIVERAMDILGQVIQQSKVKNDAIDDVVLVGGTCRMPVIQSALTTYFKKNPYKNINPDEVVACGAALRAAHLAHVNTSSEGHSAYSPPVSKIVDVIPLSLGVSVARDEMSIILERNTPIPDNRPLEKTMSYRTVLDNQTLSRWTIYQGEDKRASKNFRLGQLSITNLPPRPKGEITVDVTFSFDPSDGTLSTSAVVRGHSELRASTIIEKPSSIPADDVARLQKIELEYEKAKMTRRERDAALNDLESICFSLLADPSLKTDLKDFVTDLADWCDQNEWAELPIIQMQRKDLTEKLQEFNHPFPSQVAGHAH